MQCRKNSILITSCSPLGRLDARSAHANEEPRRRFLWVVQPAQRAGNSLSHHFYLQPPSSGLACDPFAWRCRGRPLVLHAGQISRTCPTQRVTDTYIQTTQSPHGLTVDLYPCFFLLHCTTTITTLLRAGSDLQRDSLSSSATFPATHTHVASGGSPASTADAHCLHLVIVSPRQGM